MKDYNFSTMPNHTTLSLPHGSKLKSENASMDDMGEFMCGWGAASINILATFPINKVIFRQQLLGINTRSALKMLQAEGLLKLYRGILPPMLQKTASLSIMFGMYDKFNKIFSQSFPTLPSLVQKTTSAMLAGCCEAVLTPFERVQTLMQDKFYHQRYRNTFHAFRELRRFGIMEYYRGLTLILIRNGPSNALFFQLRGEVKDLLPKSEKPSIEFLRNFASGGLVGAAISTLFFPINVLKTHMQSKVGGPLTSCRNAFLFIYEERNRSLRAIFSGARVNFIRSLISWGIINASYEKLKTLLYNND